MVFIIEVYDVYVMFHQCGCQYDMLHTITPTLGINWHGIVLSWFCNFLFVNWLNCAFVHCIYTTTNELFFHNFRPDDDKDVENFCEEKEERIKELKNWYKKSRLLALICLFVYISQHAITI